MAKDVCVFGFIDFGIFPDYCLFSCGFTYEDLVSELEKKGYKGWTKAVKSHKDYIKRGNWCALKATIKDEVFWIIVAPKAFDFTDDDYCHLAHECLHIYQWYLPSYLDIEKEIEAGAYLHSHLMKQCLKIIRG